jgi:hypothetical protein
MIKPGPTLQEANLLNPAQVAALRQFGITHVAEFVGMAFAEREALATELRVTAVQLSELAQQAYEMLPEDLQASLTLGEVGGLGALDPDDRELS